MGLKRVKKWVAVELVVTFNAYLEGTVCYRSRNAKYHIAIVDLAIVQRDLPALIDLTSNESGSAGDAPAILASIRQVDAQLSKAIEQ